MVTNIVKFIGLLAFVFLLVILPSVLTIKDVYAATSPTLSASSTYSILGASEVTCTGATTITGNVGVAAGTSITGFPSPCAVSPGTTQSNTQSAIDAQADNLVTFGALDQGCDYSYPSGQDLTLISPLVSGVYCSAGSFLLTGNLTLNGSGAFIFKTVSALTTSPGSSVTSSDSCNVWWRVGSSATLDTTTSFVGNILALTSIGMNSGAILKGRAMVQTGAVTLNGNTITAPTCAASTSTSTSSTSTSTFISTTEAPYYACPPIEIGITSPTIIGSKRVDADSIYFNWGPYTGTDKFNVRYGMSKDKLLYNVDVTGFSTTIDALPANQPIWVRIAARNDCTIGSYEQAKLVGGPSLPSAGFGPYENGSPWYLLVSIFNRFFSKL